MISNPILIVDDEVEMRIAMSETLKHCGYPVELSHNAIDALKKYKENDYSMVITDMTMPKRSGLELLKDIKRLDSAKPVIMATAYATVETAVEAMKHGAFDYIKNRSTSIPFSSWLNVPWLSRDTPARWSLLKGNPNRLKGESLKRARKSLPRTRKC